MFTLMPFNERHRAAGTVLLAQKLQEVFAASRGPFLTITVSIKIPMCAKRQLERRKLLEFNLGRGGAGSFAYFLCGEE